MSQTSNSVRLHRVLRAPAERIYRAFLEPEAMAKWLPPFGFTAKVHQIDARVGGSYRMSFTNFSTGKSEFFGGKYIELVPHEVFDGLLGERQRRVPAEVGEIETAGVEPLEERHRRFGLDASEVDAVREHDHVGGESVATDV